jgi:signal peptidase I
LLALVAPCSPAIPAHTIVRKIRYGGTLISQPKSAVPFVFCFVTPRAFSKELTPYAEAGEIVVFRDSHIKSINKNGKFFPNTITRETIHRTSTGV